MGRKTITIGDGKPNPIDNEDIQKTLFLVRTGTAGSGTELNFLDGSITYFDVGIKQSFEYVLVDNIGNGEVRIAFNRLGMDLSNAINGAKTLKSNDSLYIQDSIRNMTIYFINDSTVELILISG